ncbi:hypothetical protein [Glycomyces terrestris]|uniref:ABC transporter permease n=1 Tax=Glycomyces terrestris TaxID=2493553 RepID=A0A426US99_9ACTN|nr:hypothetical protein [Glycomyces terrestris]RRR96430.1 hypothetical protein EIW28_21555 [Glycomyces terrestris]
MTYVPPDRDDQALDQTQHLDFAAAPGAGHPFGSGVDDARPVDPFAGRPATTVGYAEAAAPARDRVGFQFVWEGILLLLTLNALFLVYQRREEVFGGGLSMDALGPHFAGLASLILVAAAFGLTLRLGAVNLAVPAMPVLVLMSPSLFVGPDPLVGLAYTAGAAAAVAVLFTVLTVVLRIPPWLAGLASLVVMGGSYAALDELAGALGSGEPGAWTNPGNLWLLLGAAVLSAIGGLIGLAPGVRERFSKVKGAADGTGDREAGSVAVLLGGTFLALLLSALAGFLPLVFGGDLEPELSAVFAVNADASLVLTPLVFIVVFLAGTSPWGRRGGVLGTVLAAVAVWALALVWNSLDQDVYGEWTGAAAAGLLLLGLFVSFGLDRLGRPREALEPEDATAEMRPFDSPNGAVDDGTGLFEPTLPDAASANR